MKQAPDIQELTVRGLKLLAKLQMMSPDEIAFSEQYVAALELYLDSRPAVAPKPTNVISFEDRAAERRVQRAEVSRRKPDLAVDGRQRQHWINEFGDDCFGYD